jgi:hypothetical protein
MKTTTKSAPMSIKGWKFLEWVKGNGKTIKELLKVGIPLAIAYFTVHNPALVAVITVGGKLILDTLEFYLREMELK